MSQHTHDSASAPSVPFQHTTSTAGVTQTKPPTVDISTLPTESVGISTIGTENVTVGNKPVAIKRKMGRPKGYPKSGGRAPGVKNHIDLDLRALCQRYTTDAVEVLQAIMHDAEAAPAARVTAARELMDRGWGRPQVTVDVALPPGAIFALAAVPDVG